MRPPSVHLTILLDRDRSSFVTIWHPISRLMPDAFALGQPFDRCSENSQWDYELERERIRSVATILQEGEDIDGVFAGIG